jgi:hypothetical protein
VSRWSVARGRREASTAGTREVGTIRSSWSWTRRERDEGRLSRKREADDGPDPEAGVHANVARRARAQSPGRRARRERRKTSTERGRPLGTMHSCRAIFGASQGAKRMNARASEHPQGCERHAKHIAASRAPHRKMHEAATPRALGFVTPLPDRRIERCGRRRVSDPQLDHRKVIDRPGYCTRTASLTCPGELGG